MADRAGQQVGNYRLLSLLGEGGLAEVGSGTNQQDMVDSESQSVFKTRSLPMVTITLHCTH